jgi:hypothetical protein
MTSVTNFDNLVAIFLLPRKLLAKSYCVCQHSSTSEISRLQIVVQGIIVK